MVHVSLDGIALIAAGALLIQGCNATPTPTSDLLAPTEAQTRMRSFQSRTFDIADRKVAMRGVIAVLQDLGFIIERANEPLGLVTAARFAAPNYYDIVAVTITVRTLEGGRMEIRANAIFNNRPVEDVEAYQKFFAALEKSLLLTQG